MLSDCFELQPATTVAVNKRSANRFTISPRYSIGLINCRWHPRITRDSLPRQRFSSGQADCQIGLLLVDGLYQDTQLTCRHGKFVNQYIVIGLLYGGARNETRKLHSSIRLKVPLSGHLVIDVPVGPLPSFRIMY